MAMSHSTDMVHVLYWTHARFIEIYDYYGSECKASYRLSSSGLVKEATETLLG